MRVDKTNIESTDSLAVDLQAEIQHRSQKNSYRTISQYVLSKR